MTTLEILCKTYNLQDCNIHEAISHYKGLSQSEKDKAFSVIMPNLSIIEDLDNVKLLSAIRNQHLHIQGVNHA